MAMKVNGYEKIYNPIPNCKRCDKTPDTDKVAKCGRCLLVNYCSDECQKQHWPTHKKICQIKSDPLDEAENVFPAFFIEQGKIVCRQIEITSEMNVISKKMSELIELSCKTSTDFGRIKSALTLIEFLEEHKDFLYINFGYASLILSSILVNLFKLSDKLKYRHACFLPESGWWYLGIFISLIYPIRTAIKKDSINFMIYMTSSHPQ